MVDYIGLAADLKAALAHYSQSDKAQTGVDESEAVAAFLDALDVVRAQLHGLDYVDGLDGSGAERLRLLSGALEFLMEKERQAEAGGVIKRFLDAVAALTRAYKLASGNEATQPHATETAFYFAVRSGLEKTSGAGAKKSARDADFAIEQLVNRAVGSTEVVDILEACGFDRPDISVLSEDFLMEIQGMRHKNLAVEALKKLLNGEISARTRSNVVQREVFSERLLQAVTRYHNRSVDAMQVLQELIQLAHDLRSEPGDGLSEEERAFYDALAQNRSAVEAMANKDLQAIAAALVQSIRSNGGPDWWRRDNVRARMRREVKKILRKFGYPPDLEQEAIKTVLKQAEALAYSALSE